MILQLIAAFFGTITFALLFGVPKEDYLVSGLNGALGWLVYCLLTKAGMGAEGASFFATIVVVLGARYFAVVFQTPSTMFLIPGIFPLVPGGGIYWTAYYFVQGYSEDALEYGMLAIRCAFCIVLGIVFVLQLPGRLFKNAAFWKRER